MSIVSASASDVTAQPAIERSTEFWDDNPDLVLRTTKQHDNCVVHTMYGVAKSVLCRSSRTFADWFGGPLVAFIIGSAVYEGLPVMNMWDDPDDVEHFLRMIHYPW